jgi:phenylpyruvate tautomerase PptA (4-oxalocrotonate tautomerase family)
MPVYEFEHVIRLAASQKAALAKAITDWHATSFNAPRYIVQCRFIDINSGPLSEIFVGGQPRKINRLSVSLRSGSGRTQEQLESMTNKLVAMWNGIAGSTPEAQLRAVYIKGTLDAAFEGGFHLPMVCLLLSYIFTLIVLNSLENLNNGSKIIRRNLGN